VRERERYVSHTQTSRKVNEAFLKPFDHLNYPFELELLPNCPTNHHQPGFIYMSSPPQDGTKHIIILQLPLISKTHWIYHHYTTAYQLCSMNTATPPLTLTWHANMWQILKNHTIYVCPTHVSDMFKIQHGSMIGVFVLHRLPNIEVHSFSTWESPSHIYYFCVYTSSSVN